MRESSHISISIYIYIYTYILWTTFVPHFFSSNICIKVCVVLIIGIVETRLGFCWSWWSDGRHPVPCIFFPTISDISYKTSRWGWLSWWSSWICRKSQTFVHRHIMTYINCTIYWFVCGHYSWKTSKMRWPFLLRFQSIFFMNPLLLCFFIAFNTQATSSESTVTLSLDHQCEVPLLWL